MMEYLKFSNWLPINTKLSFHFQVASVYSQSPIQIALSYFIFNANFIGIIIIIIIIETAFAS